MRPAFSIITVTYNAAEWIEKTILSVLNQSYSPIEYIIIDGASTDGTPEIIKQYSEGIRYWISEPDKGIYDAMNKGLQQATGNYVWFLNAGDTLYNNDIIQQIVASLPPDSELPDIMYGNTAIINTQGKYLHMRRLQPPPKLNWKSFKKGMLVCHQSFISKRKIAPLYNINYKLSADFEWCIVCMKKAKYIYNTHMTLSNFLEEGASSKNIRCALKERFNIMKDQYGYFSTLLWHSWFAMRYYSSKWIKGRV